MIGDPPRLIAYGGRSYTLRTVLGSWSGDIKRFYGSLGDRAGLAANRVVCGLVFPDNRPALLFRKMQQQGDRSYPYGLLLDPGRPCWERFRWNAILLLDSLREDQELWSVLEDPPPSGISSELLSGRLQGLAPPNRREDVRPRVPPAVIWTSSMLDSGTPTALSPSVLGLSDCPSLPELHDLLEHLPAAVAAGGGWISCGAVPHAETLGATLVIDPSAPAEPQEGNATIQERGERFLRLVEDLRKYRAQFGNAAKGVLSSLETPIALWDRTTENWVSEAHGWCEAAALALENKKPTCHLTPEQEQWVLQQIGASQGRFSPAVTSWLLERWRRVGAQDHPELGKRLDPISTSTFLLANLSFSRTPGLVLPQDGWVATIRNATCEDLDTLMQGPLGLASGTHPKALIDAVLMQIKEADCPLSKVMGFVEEYGKPVLQRLYLLAIERAIAGKPASWAEDYLVTNADPGGEIVAANLADQDVSRLVEGVLECLQRRQTQEPARRWLGNLARSGLRKRCTLNCLHRAAAACTRNWPYFRTLESLFLGRSPRTVPRLPERNAHILECIARETTLLAKALSPGCPAPDLAGLLSWLGHLEGPKRVLDEMAEELKPSLAEGSPQGWIAGLLLRAEGNASAVANRILQDVLSGQSRRPRSKDIPKSVQEELLQHLLWGEDTEIEKASREELARWASELSEHVAIELPKDRDESSLAKHLKTLYWRFNAVAPDVVRQATAQLVNADPSVLDAIAENVPDWFGTLVRDSLLAVREEMRWGIALVGQLECEVLRVLSNDPTLKDLQKKELRAMFGPYDAQYLSVIRRLCRGGVPS